MGYHLAIIQGHPWHWPGTELGVVPNDGQAGLVRGRWGRFGISILLQSQLLFLLVKIYNSVKYIFPVRALGLLVSEWLTDCNSSSPSFADLGSGSLAGARCSSRPWQEAPAWITAASVSRFTDLWGVRGDFIVVRKGLVWGPSRSSIHCYFPRSAGLPGRTWWDGWLWRSYWDFENREQGGRCILSIACKTLGRIKERRHGFEEDEIVRLPATSGTLEVSRIIYQMKYFEQRWDRTYKLHEELWKRTVANGMHQIRKSVRIIQVTWRTMEPAFDSYLHWEAILLYILECSGEQQHIEI